MRELHLTREQALGMGRALRGLAEARDNYERDPLFDAIVIRFGDPATQEASSANTVEIHPRGRVIDLTDETEEG